MNRRDFMKAALLVPLALAMKVQVEPKSGKLVRFHEDGVTLNWGSSPSEAHQWGYEMGQKAWQGYTEGIEKPVSSMVITYYDHTDWEKVRWDDVPEVLPEVEFEFKPLRPAREIVIL